MDERTRVYWLFRCLKGLPGFAYRPNGLFEYWGVPLHEIPASVFERAKEACYFASWLKEIESPSPYGRTGLTQSLATEIVERVDTWLAARHCEAIA